MKLTQHTDYSLRVLMYLASNDSCPTIGTIAEYFGISKNHLVKVTHRLTKLGYIQSIRGRSGGLRLSMDPKKVVLGEVVREMESSFQLVECFDKDSNGCRVTENCKLKHVLGGALHAFNAHLDSFTLADFALPASNNAEKIIARSNESGHLA
ncbi:MAG: Rrf2 family transcriptional regulator [Pseudohongiella sp.]|nr:Rrf2 family transcriptional regulator [Pseudohongiella sp.]